MQAKERVKSNKCRFMFNRLAWNVCCKQRETLQQFKFEIE